MADLARSQSQWNELHCWITVHHWFCHLLLHGEKKKEKKEKKKPQCMLESPYSSCVQQTTFTRNSILTLIRSGCLGWVCRCVRRLCACMCAWEVNVSVCAYVCGRKDKQSWQSSHFCLMKNGRLAFRDVVMCRILMCAHQTASPTLKMSGTEVKPSIDQPRGRSNSRGNISSLNLQMGRTEFCRRTSFSLTRGKAGSGDMMFGCFRKDSQSQQIVQ